MGKQYHQFPPSLPEELRNCLTQEEYSRTVEEINAILSRQNKWGILMLLLAVPIGCTVFFYRYIGEWVLYVAPMIVFGLCLIGFTFLCFGRLYDNRLAEVNAYCSKLNSSCSWSVGADTMSRVIRNLYHIRRASHTINCTLTRRMRSQDII